MRRNISKSLLEATQKRMDEWVEKIKETIQGKEQKLDAYAEKKQQLLPYLMEAHEKHVSSRELGKITGISHATISKWIREEKQKAKETQQDAERPS